MPYYNVVGKISLDLIEIPVQFNEALDRVKVQIYPNIGTPVLRDMRDSPFSNGPEYGGPSNLGWPTLFIRCDDQIDPSLLNGKMQILIGLYWAPKNVDNMAPAYGDHPADPWGDVPIMGIDTCCFGAWKKDVVIDGIVKSSYDPGVGNGARSFWLEGRRIPDPSSPQKTIDDFTQNLRIFP